MSDGIIQEGQHAILEETDTAFDPASQHLTLSKDEKRRTTALLMAIQYHSQTIVKDAAMYRELVHDNKHLSPSVCEKVIEIAFQFDAFISGGTTDAIHQLAKAIIKDQAERAEVDAEKPTQETQPEAK